MFFIDRSNGSLFYDGHIYDPTTRTWKVTPVPNAAKQIDPTQAVAWVQRESGHPLRAPVSIIGPNDATDEQVAVATDAGAVVGRMGLAVLCGGRGGVMKGASQGVSSVGGVAIGLLPHENLDQANTFISVGIASGIGEARNAIIARAGSCLIAIGNNHGTLSEVALGLQFGKCVFGLAGAPQVDGVIYLAHAHELEEALAKELLRVHARVEEHT